MPDDKLSTHGVIRNDGGNAFPGKGRDAFGSSMDVPGMSLRDFFAGQALMGMLAAGDIEAEVYEAAADYAYSYADAMLKERST
jgi:hypothetical protein